MKRFLISGGGTGGHIFPALAIAQQLKKEFVECEILFIGAKGKMEMERVPAAGFNIVGLEVFGIRRDFSWGAIESNLRLPFVLLKTMRKAKQIIREFKPDVAIGVGGYASGPALRAAIELKIPTIIQEQNSYPGIANKLLAKKVITICAGYPGLDKFFSKEKIVLTGNPVRENIINIEKKLAIAYQKFQFSPNKKTVLVIGGSQGARTINQAIETQIDDFKKLDIQLLWQTGKIYYENNKSKIEELECETIKIVPFIEKMELAYSVADFIVSRAGALAIAELTLVGAPTLLIPLPTAAEDHQTANAKVLSNANAAILIPDKQAREILLPTLTKIIDDENRAAELAKNIKMFAQPNAIHSIIVEIKKLLTI